MTEWMRIREFLDEVDQLVERPEDLLENARSDALAAPDSPQVNFLVEQFDIGWHFRSTDPNAPDTSHA